MVALQEYPELPKGLEKFLKMPYGGLFGNNVQTMILEEIAADPYSVYRPKDFEELTGASAPAIRKSIKNLVELGLLIKEEGDIQHPSYKVNLKSKKLLALNFLAYASIDDRDGSNAMDDAICDYCINIQKIQSKPLDYAEVTLYQYLDEGPSDVDVLASNNTGSQAIVNRMVA